MRDAAVKQDDSAWRVSRRKTDPAQVFWVVEQGFPVPTVLPVEIAVVQGNLLAGVRVDVMHV